MFSFKLENLKNRCTIHEAVNTAISAILSRVFPRLVFAWESRRHRATPRRVAQSSKELPFLTRFKRFKGTQRPQLERNLFQSRWAHAKCCWLSNDASIAEIGRELAKLCTI